MLTATAVARKRFTLTIFGMSVAVIPIDLIEINSIRHSPYYVFVVLCIVVIVVSLIKIAAWNANIECFRECFAVGYRAPA